MSEFCRGVTADGQCDCEEFSPSEDPDKPLICGECAHGRSKHPKKIDEPQATGKSSVLKLFQGVTGKKGTSFEHARSEMLQGQSSSSTTTGKTARKGKGKVCFFVISKSK
jgi:hypothetical protein